MTYEQFQNNPATKKSGELDFGVQWMMGTKRYPLFRVSWVENTGQLYAVPETPNLRNEEVVLIGMWKTRNDIELFLKGWPDLCGSPFSLNKLLDMARSI